MALQLKGGNNEIDPFKPNNTSDYSPNEYDIPIELEQKIHQTTVIPKEDSTGKKLVSALLKTAIFLIIIAIGFKVVPLIAGKIIERTSLDSYTNKTQAEFETELGLTFENDPDLVSKLPLADLNGVTAVTSKKGLSVIYKNGKQVGFFFTSNDYILYNVKKGDAEQDVYEDTIHPKDTYWEILNDIGGVSTASFFEDLKNNTCMVVVFNNTSNRVAAVAFFNDRAVPNAQLDDEI